MMDYTKAPQNMQGGLRRYFESGTEPGGCLRAILENDLMGAFSRADATTELAMRDIVGWLYCEAPTGSYGSKGKVAEWIKQGGMAGLRKGES